MATVEEDVRDLVDGLNYAEKVERSLRLVEEALDRYGDRLVVANSLGKDSSVIWHLAQRVNPIIRGFVVTTRFKPRETVEFMHRTVEQSPQIRVFRNDEPIPVGLHQTEPDRCCDLLKVQPTQRAIREMDVACWVTGLRCTEGRTRTDFRETEERDPGLVKLNPILIWHEREVWQYLALNHVPVNPLYEAGYRVSRLRSLHPDRGWRGRARGPLDRDEQMRRRVRHPYASSVAGRAARRAQRGRRRLSGRG